MREFKNSNENGNPAAKKRYASIAATTMGKLEFTGENETDHTPKDESIRIYTGNAFDLTGERHRMDCKLNSKARWVDESFEIKVRNHKTSPAEGRVVQHLYRWNTWGISKRGSRLAATWTPLSAV